MSVRIGVLGCARIAPIAMVRPARRVRGVEVAAVASRRIERARRFARRHDIPTAYGSYGDLIADPSIDAVYVPLPNALHAEWAVAALEAGKHVLCEKPLATTEHEAKEMAACAERTGRVAMEAYHHRYHPLFRRIEAIVGSRELGELRRIDMRVSVPVLLPGDIRWDPELGGGAAMDVGCYAISTALALAPGTPLLRTASGSVGRRGVDRSFRATIAFPREVQAHVEGSILGPPYARLRVSGTRGEVAVTNPIFPQVFYRLRVTVDGSTRRETVDGGSTYAHQLAAFAAAVRGEADVPTSFDAGVETMRVIDQVRVLLGVEA